MTQCPQCHQRETFALDAFTPCTAHVTQRQTPCEDGPAGELTITDAYAGRGTWWAEDAACLCLSCHYSAPLGRFQSPEDLVLVEHDVF